ncbi:hypothetical protein Csa_007656 [Cucumis sativus]|uniref:Uncharacterized protein n=1 Tax=Cucumis sativus TaxID=3659 RepID=A0A0A0LYW0_CUCSA|nr:hypothetical protein Csa_007656 [Cucumis sativus]
MGFNLMIHYSDDEDDQNYKHECSYLDEWRYSMRMREKRQIFLRSYEFQLMSRKRSKKKKEKRRSVGHNIKTGLLKIKRVIWVRLNKLKLNINNHCFLPSPSRIRIRRTTFFRLHIH